MNTNQDNYVIMWKFIFLKTFEILFFAFAVTLLICAIGGGIASTTLQLNGINNPEAEINISFYFVFTFILASLCMLLIEVPFTKHDMKLKRMKYEKEKLFQKIMNEIEYLTEEEKYILLDYIQSQKTEV
jgi:hypothetical protein